MLSSNINYHNENDKTQCLVEENSFDSAKVSKKTTLISPKDTKKELNKHNIIQNNLQLKFDRQPKTKRWQPKLEKKVQSGVNSHKNLPYRDNLETEFEALKPYQNK